MADVAGMHQVENAMAHDHGLFAWARAERGAQFVDRLDFTPVVAGDPRCHQHHTAPRASNQVFVARLIESGSHSGASRQLSISAIIRADRKSTRLNSSHLGIS